MLLPKLHETVLQLTKEFNQIPTERKATLAELTQFINERKEAGKVIQLNFICTHNSRRSHVSQLWAQAAAHHFQIENVACFSGGTEATAFNPRAVDAMQKAGFDISIDQPGNNPLYGVKYADNAPPVKAFSKKYDDSANPKQDFAAIMTCSHADQNCPIVVGATKRIAITYNDPKDFDGTPLETSKYQETVSLIGREILFAFSNVKK